GRGDDAGGRAVRRSRSGRDPPRRTGRRAFVV
ncbi:MAG: hypothetical protein AVDCRST_MAG80-607, partial [uncultured Rubrobacteraceae bacterium]